MRHNDNKIPNLIISYKDSFKQQVSSLPLRLWPSQKQQLPQIKSQNKAAPNVYHV
jgi:hypothetical protein